MTHIQGKDLMIFKVVTASNVETVYKVVASCKSCSIQIDSETIEISSPTSDIYKDYIPKRKGWKVSCNYLVSDTENDITSLLNHVGGKYLLQVSQMDGSGHAVSGQTLRGYAICTSCQMSAQVGNLLSGSFEFQGAGELASYTPPAS